MVSVPWWFLEVTGAEDNHLTGWLRSRLDHMESVLKEREWLATDRFTVADVSVGYSLQLATRLGLSPQFTPAVAAYWERLQKREAYSRALKSQHDAAAAQGVSTRPAAEMNS